MARPPSVAARFSASLFLPCAGYCNGSNRNNAGTNGNYWSSSLNTSNPHNAYNLYFCGIPEDEDFDWNMNTNNRYNGFSVRAVRSRPFSCSTRRKNIPKLPPDNEMLFRNTNDKKEAECTD